MWTIHLEGAMRPSQTVLPFKLAARAVSELERIERDSQSSAKLIQASCRDWRLAGKSRALSRFAEAVSIAKQPARIIRKLVCGP
jgi:hypothetical protein